MNKHVIIALGIFFAITGFAANVVIRDWQHEYTWSGNGPDVVLTVVTTTTTTTTTTVPENVSLAVSGNPTPDITGNYFRNGTHAGYPAYEKMATHDYWVWRENAYWQASTSPGDTSAGGWENSHGLGPDCQYDDHFGICSGVPVVGEVQYSVTVLTPLTPDVSGTYTTNGPYGVDGRMSYKRNGTPTYYLYWSDTYLEMAVAATKGETTDMFLGGGGGEIRSTYTGLGACSGTFDMGY